jgi:hypothetical protein
MRTNHVTITAIGTTNPDRPGTCATGGAPVGTVADVTERGSPAPPNAAGRWRQDLWRAV